jgi:hypothetical protein
MTENDRTPLDSGSPDREPELVSPADAALIRGGMMQLLPGQSGTCIPDTKLAIPDLPRNRPRRWLPVPDDWWLPRPF